MGLSLSTTSLTIIANTPQLLLSLVYLMINRLITAMSVSREWAAFATSRKGLRTTKPMGSQRSTYWLQIPYRIAVPMMAVSTALHNITSQVLFFGKIRVYANDVATTASVLEEVSGLGFSNAALMALTILVSVLLLLIILLGVLVSKSKLPPVFFSSAIISAACQRPDWDISAHEKPVKWGEVVEMRVQDADGEIVGHCCFSSKDVVELEEGKLYM